MVYPPTLSTFPFSSTVIIGRKATAFAANIAGRKSIANSAKGGEDVF
jgi:hypothetical protein